MAKKTIAEVKSRFESDDIPSGQDFIDLIDTLEDASLLEAHKSAYVHGDIAHANRAELNQVSGINTGDQDLSPYATTLTVLSGLSAKADQVTTYTKTETDSRIQAVVGAAPAALDTLKEIADQLANDESAASALTTTVSGKENVGVAATLDSAHLTAFVHANIAHANRAALDLVAGTNTGDETLATIKTKLGVTTLSGSNTGDQVIPTTLPASDVSAWAKAAVKPAYTKAEVGLGNADNTADASKPVATVTVNGIMSASDKTKLDGIAVGANNYTHPATHPPAIIAQDATNRFVTDAEKAVWNSSQTALGYTPENTINKNVANGYAPLDSGAKIPTANLPDAILGAMKFQSVWNAATNTPAIPAASSANTGWYYVVNVSGASNVSGISDWVVGDWVVSNGTGWAKVDNTDSCSSVFGRTGAIISNAGDYNADQITETATKVFVTPAQKTVLGNTTNVNTGDETTATIKTKLGIITLSGSNTGDQTTVSGNAGTATKLQTARTINGVSFDGSANITLNAVDATAREAAIAAGTTAQYLRGDKSWQTMPTSLPASDVSAWAKSPTKPAYTAAEVGLGNVPNLTFSGANTGDETAATIKTKLGITTLSGSNTGDQDLSSYATTATTYTKTETDTRIQAVVGAAPAALDTLQEIAAQLATDESAVSALTTAVSGKEATGVAASLDSAHLAAFVHSNIAHANRAALDAVSGTNTGDETTATIKTKLGVATLSGANTGDQVIPTTLPASDVYPWAKAATKPAYTAAEVGAGDVTTTGTQTLTNKTLTAPKGTKVALPANDINVTSGDIFTKTITGATTFTVSNVPAAGTSIAFMLELTNGGVATITWWGGVKWAGGTAPALTAAGRDVLGFYTHDGGTTWSGFVLGKDVK